MKVVWGKFGTGVDLIVCAISSYWWVSLWVNEKDAIHAYTLKPSIIVFLGIMFFLSIAAYGTVTFLLKRIYIYEWGIMLSFWGYEKKIEWEDFTVIIFSSTYRNRKMTVCPGVPITHLPVS